MNGAADSNAKAIFHSNARKEHTNKWFLPTPQKETFEAKGARERERERLFHYCIWNHEVVFVHTKQNNSKESIQFNSICE